MIDRSMPRNSDIVKEPYYQSALQPEYSGPDSPYANYPTDLEYEQPEETVMEDEFARRAFASSQEPLLPANQLGSSLSGNNADYDTWRDVCDVTVLVTATPGAGSATATQSFSMGTVPNPPTYSGLSPALQILIRDLRAPRLALCVRSVGMAAQTTALANPGTPPTMTTAASGGTIAAGVYLGAYTYIDAAGETAGSPLEPVTTTGAASTITWTVPALPQGATAVRYYLSGVGGTQLFLQGSNATTTFTLTAPPVVTGVEALPGLNTTAPVIGAVLLALITGAGDTLPLGAYPAGGFATNTSPNITGPTSIADLSGNFYLQLTSVNVSAPVPITFQIGMSVIAVHPHSIAKRFVDLAVNK